MNNMRRNKCKNQNNWITLGSKRARMSASVSTNVAVEQAHIVEVPQVTGQAFDAKAKCTDSNNNFQVDSYNINDDAISYYDWLADSCTTSHICNKHNSFIEYHPSNAKVRGVGNTLTEIHRCGTVKVQACVNDITQILILQDVLYVPSNQYNLLLLRRWDSHGRHFKSSQGTLSLIDQDGRVITCSLKLKSNLYKMKIHITHAME